MTACRVKMQLGPCRGTKSTRDAIQTLQAGGEGGLATGAAGPRAEMDR